MTIGERVKTLRKKNNLTQEKLAEYLCVSYQAVSKWERGLSSPDLFLIEPLTRIFNISADELLGIKDSSDNKIREKYDEAMHKYRCGSDHTISYQWARDATLAFQDRVTVGIRTRRNA